MAAALPRRQPAGAQWRIETTQQFEERRDGRPGRHLGEMDLVPVLAVAEALEVDIEAAPRGNDLLNQLSSILQLGGPLNQLSSILQQGGD